MKAALEVNHEELTGTHPEAPGACKSTLTLLRLGLADELGHSQWTNNEMKSVNNWIQHNTRNVKHGTNSYHVHCYVAMAMVESEKRLKRIPHAEHHPRLRAALQQNMYRVTHHPITCARRPSTNFGVTTAMRPVLQRYRSPNWKRVSACKRLRMVSAPS